MPRYQFHVIDGHDHIDPQVVEFRDHDTMRIDAIRYAGQCLADLSLEPGDGHDWTMRVSDTDDRTMLKISVVITM